jgi:hypothetical protein
MEEVAGKEISGSVNVNQPLWQMINLPDEPALFRNPIGALLFLRQNANSSMHVSE